MRPEGCPIFGILMQKIAVARFCRTLSTLISSGVPILDGLEITARTAGNAIVEDAIMTVRKGVEGGLTIAQPLKESGVFPPMVVQMIGVGEQTGALDAMLGKIADFYEEEVDQAVANLLTLMEPVMILFLGITVGGIVISMYLPLFDLISKLSSLSARRIGRRRPVDHGTRPRAAAQAADALPGGDGHHPAARSPSTSRRSPRRSLRVNPLYFVIVATYAPHGRPRPRPAVRAARCAPQVYAQVVGDLLIITGLVYVTRRHPRRLHAALPDLGALGQRPALPRRGAWCSPALATRLLRRRSSGPSGPGLVPPQGLVGRAVPPHASTSSTRSS